MLATMQTFTLSVILCSVLALGGTTGKPKAVLSVSPTWLSPGATYSGMFLNCEVKESSTFNFIDYWFYTAVLGPDGNYINKFLPRDLISFNSQSSFSMDGSTIGTAGYTCRVEYTIPAVPGVSYTDYSDKQFVFSGDRHSSAALTVSPDRTQHFIDEPVSLICEGNPTGWTLEYLTEKGAWPIQCSYPTTSMTTCKVSSTYDISSVFWCLSTSEYSNAINITVASGSVILVSPVHPVPKGSSVTLECQHRTDNSLSNVDFYRNEELVQSMYDHYMIISAVSESDEGFYKCSISGEESPQSWMAVNMRYAVLHMAPE